jgi:hypothetical protein
MSDSKYILHDSGVIKAPQGVTGHSGRSRGSVRKYREVRFASLAQAARFCLDDDTPHKWSSRSSESDDTSWAGSRNLREACEWALNGTWKCPDIDALTAAYDHGSMADVPQTAWESDVVGVRANVPAFCAGTPDSMFTLVEPDTCSRVVKLVVGKFYSASVPSAVITDISAAVLAWIASVEQHAKVSVEVTLAICTHHNRGLVQNVLIPVKRAGEALDISECAFGLVSPALFRRIGFRIMETLPDSYRDAYGIGCVVPNHVLDECDLYLPNIVSASSNAAYAEAERFKTMLQTFIDEEL